MITSSANTVEPPDADTAPSGCRLATDSGSSSNSLVYLTGALGYDFGTYARRDALEIVNNHFPLQTNSDLSNYLLLTPTDAESVIWTLIIGSTPIYAIRPMGPYAKRTYQQLHAYLLDPNIDRIFVAGRIVDSVRLLNGLVVPVIVPDLEGLKPWSPLSIAPPVGHLTVEAQRVTAGTSVNLTGEGSLDWMHWGGVDPDTAIDRNQKLSVALPGLTIGKQIAQTPVETTRQTGYSASFFWNDGMPTIKSPSPDLVPGYLRLGSSGRFTLTIPADTSFRVLKLYVRNDGGSDGGQCKLTVTLNSLSAEDRSFVASSNQSIDGIYTVAFQTSPAMAPNSTLTVSWEPLGTNFAGLQAATLHIGNMEKSSALQSYLERIHFELRNMGAHAHERALNFAASYATIQQLSRFSSKSLFGAMFEQGMVLEDLAIRRNDRCRPEGDCWDVLFRFFNPASNTEWSRPIFRLTADVSTVKPLVLRQLQRWNEF
jgi:hypothetical protein